MPPPKINLNIPNIIATTHIVFPPLEFPILLIINPTTANGITIQFSQPNNGIKASNIPSKEITPKSEPIIFMIFLVFWSGNMYKNFKDVGLAYLLLLSKYNFCKEL